MDFIPYLFFYGQAKEAMNYYQETLGGKILASVEYGTMVNPEETNQLPEDYQHYLMHGALEVEGKRILFSDEFPSNNQLEYNDVSIALMSNDFSQLENYFTKLEKEATEVMVPFQATDWSPGYGMLRDKFGIKWQLNYEI